MSPVASWVLQLAIIAALIVGAVYASGWLRVVLIAAILLPVALIALGVYEIGWGPVRTALIGGGKPAIPVPPPGSTTVKVGAIVATAQNAPPGVGTYVSAGTGHDATGNVTYHWKRTA